jgi:hypothetical protein
MYFRTRELSKCKSRFLAHLEIFRSSSKSSSLVMASFGMTARKGRNCVTGADRSHVALVISGAVGHIEMWTGCGLYLDYREMSKSKTGHWTIVVVSETGWDG